MKFNFLIIFSLLSCAPQLTTINQNKPYTAKGIAYIYNDFDFQEKIIKGKMNNSDMQISIQNLKTGALIKIINPKNEESIVLKNKKRIQYPKFYKILITQPVVEKLDLNTNLPILEIIEIKKNKSFVAKKAKMYSEEKKIPSNAPVTSVEISNISKNQSPNTRVSSDKIFIHLATFYSADAAKFLTQRINKEVVNFDSKKLKIKKINSKETHVISGPYTSVNLLKNDYIKLAEFGFEEMDVLYYE